MARFWKEPYDWTRHRDRMYGFDTPVNEYYKAKSLIPYDVYFVNVCSFTFEFHSLQQIEACLEFYARKIHPGGRVNIGGADHWECERWYEKLPMYLLEEPKRKKVVKALEDALKKFTSEGSKS